MRMLPFATLALLPCLALPAAPARAQSPQFVPAYPLYCRGPLSTSAPAAGGRTSTPFHWAAQGAGTVAPGPGQCSWADRAARGTEIRSGGGNVICDWSHAMRSVPAGQFVELGVERDPLSAQCMHLSRWLGRARPPFPAVPALPPFTRPSVASLTAAQVASLRHGFQVMMSRPVTDPTSFRFQANIHGTTDTPTTPAETQAWNQCEHGSYYFLSWHRMYLYFFDRILRAAAGDPRLVLPYWDWTDPAQRALPVPFRTPANATNPLFIAAPGRPAALNAGTAMLAAGTVDDSVAFAATAFDSPAGSGLSFGGQVVPPMQFNAPHGRLEGQPHDVVHVALAGLMGDPDTAARDPVFWLHHANIDRLWNRWIHQGGGRHDATDAAWLNTRFTFYDEAGQAVYLTGAQIEDSVEQLNYRYEDDPPFAGALAAAARETPLEAPAGLAAESAAAASSIPEPLELAASTPLPGGGRVPLGRVAKLAIPLDEETRTRIAAVLEHPEKGTVLLRLDDLQYESSDGVYYEVYLEPEGDPVGPKTPGFLGNLGLFGLRPHAAAGHHGGPGAAPFAEFEAGHRLAPLLASHAGPLNVLLVPRGLVDAHGQPLPLPAESHASLAGARLVIH